MCISWHVEVGRSLALVLAVAAMELSRSALPRGMVPRGTMASQRDLTGALVGTFSFSESL